MIDFIKNIRKKYFSESQWFLWFLFILIIIITLYPFLKIGITSADDFGTYLVTRLGTVFEDAIWYAKNQGRFYFVIAKPLYAVPYLIDNFCYTKIVQYATLVLSFILFTVTINKIFKLKEFGWVIFLLLFTFLTVANFHIPVVTYPFYFTCSFSIFLLSLLRFLKYTETKKYKFLIQSAILYAITLLFYENYLIFLLFMLGFFICRNIFIQGWKVITKKSLYKEILPFAIVIIIYVCSYFIFRKSIQDEAGFYTGSSFVEDFKLRNFFTVLWNYNKAAFPTYIYHYFRNVIEMFSLLPEGHQHNFGYMLTHSSIMAIINAFIQCFILVFLLNRTKPTISWQKAGLGFLIVFLFTFSVHILVAVSEKYQASDYWRNVSGYITTYYSYFCITLLIGFVIYASIKISYNYKWIHKILIGGFALLVFCISIMISYSNEHLSRAWQQSQNRFIMMDKVLEKGILSKISENSITYAGEMNPSLYDFGLGICGYPTAWKDYISAKTGKELNIHSLRENFEENILQLPQQSIYYVNYFDSPKTQDILLVLSKIDSNSIKYNCKEKMLDEMTSRETTVYYLSSCKEFTFEFYIPECKHDSTVFINDTGFKVSRGLNAITIDNKNKKEEITSFSVKSSEAFSAKDFSVSSIGHLETETYYIDNSN